MHRRVAIALVVMLAAMNFTAATPLVPTLPHRSWSLEQWVMPWPIRVAHAATERADEQEYVQAVDYETLDDILIGVAVSYLFGEFVRALDDLIDWLFTP